MITSHQLLAATGITSARTLTRWHRRDIIPAPTIGTHPSGRGKLAFWPEWVLPHCQRIVELRRDGYSLEAAARQAERERTVCSTPSVDNRGYMACEAGAAQEPQQGAGDAEPMAAMVSHLENLPEGIRERGRTIIRAAHAVHDTLGPGLCGDAYERALAYELGKKGLDVEMSCCLAVRYGKLQLRDAIQPDMVVAGSIIVEIKNVARLEPLHEAQVRNLLRWTNNCLAILVNFNVAALSDGTRLYVQQCSSPGSDQASQPKEIQLRLIE